MDIAHIIIYSGFVLIPVTLIICVTCYLIKSLIIRKSWKEYELERKIKGLEGKLYDIRNIATIGEFEDKNIKSMSESNQIVYINSKLKSIIEVSKL